MITTEGVGGTSLSRNLSEVVGKTPEAVSMEEPGAPYYARSFGDVVVCARLIKGYLGGERKRAIYRACIYFAARLLGVRAVGTGRVQWYLPANSSYYLRSAGLDPVTLRAVDLDLCRAAWFQLVETGLYRPWLQGEWLERIARGQITGRCERVEAAIARRRAGWRARELAAGRAPQETDYLRTKISQSMRINRDKRK